MIGIIDQRKIFEFRSNDELIRALDFYASKLNECTVIIITDAQDKVKCVIAEEQLVFEPSLELETNYYMRFFKLGRGQRVSDVEFPTKNSVLPAKMKSQDIPMHRFKFIECRTPKEIE